MTGICDAASPSEPVEYGEVRVVAGKRLEAREALGKQPLDEALAEGELPALRLGLALRGGNGLLRGGLLLQLAGGGRGALLGGLFADGQLVLGDPLGDLHDALRVGLGFGRDVFDDGRGAFAHIFTPIAWETSLAVSSAW